MNEIDKPFLFKDIRCPDGYWQDTNNIILAIDYMVEDMIKTGKLNSYENINNICVPDFKKYNLGSIIKFGVIHILNIYAEYKLGYKFKEWQFRSTQNNFWDNSDNIKNAIKWMLEEKENWDTNNLQWLIENYNSKLYKKHKLTSIYEYFYKSNNILSDNSLISLLYLAYPNLQDKIFVWEFNNTGNNYWTKEKADIALKQLIEYRLNIKNVKDLPKFFSKSLFKYKYSKFMMLLNEFYNGNIFEWINSIYPNIFTCRDFGYIECLDGTIVKSYPEQLIHNYLIDIYDNVKYIHNTKDNYGVYYNDKKSVPDWVIYDQYVIEYLGLERKKNNGGTRVDIYKEKTKRKIGMAENNTKYIYIFIYEEDLLHNLYNLKNKLSTIIKSPN